MSGGRRVKPTLDTRFHIDYEWWKRNERELRVYLISHLLPDQRAFFETNYEAEEVDWVDPDTAEVRRVDALAQALHEASQDEEYILPQTSLVDGVFRVFIASGNKPLTPIELGNLLNRSPKTILRTLGSLRVYKGLRPYLD